jgi:creatinine amidohydrolase
MPILLEELNPQSLKQFIDESGLIYLPLGTLEWHQHHLPFEVDAYVAHEICLRAAKETNGCLIPPVYFGTDREHDVDGKIMRGMDAMAGRILPGSLYFLQEKLFEKYLRQIVQNIIEQGFKKLVIVSGHSGTAQQRTVEKVAETMSKHVPILAFPGKAFVGGIDHAAKIETSLIMAIRPDLVDRNRLKGEPPYEGLVGDDPREASSKEGDERLQKIVEQIVTAVKN